MYVYLNRAGWLEARNIWVLSLPAVGQAANAPTGPVSLQHATGVNSQVWNVLRICSRNEDIQTESITSAMVSIKQPGTPYCSSGSSLGTSAGRRGHAGWGETHPGCPNQVPRTPWQ